MLHIIRLLYLIVKFKRTLLAVRKLIKDDCIIPTKYYEGSYNYSILVRFFYEEKASEVAQELRELKGMVEKRVQREKELSSSKDEGENIK